MTQPIPKEQVTADIAIFQNLIAELNPDPHCRVGGCFGRGYLGFQVVPTKDGPRLQLLTCKCSRPGKNQYHLLKDQLDQGLGFLHSVQTAQLEALSRRTFFGGIEYLWGKVWRKKK